MAFYFGKDYIFKGNKTPDENQQNTDQPSNNKTDNKDPDNSSVIPSSDAFLFPIEDVFTITGRGTVVTGQVVRGSVKVGDEIEIVGLGEKKKVIVDGIEMFRETRDEAVVGDNAGLLLRDISRDEVQRGQVLAKVNSIGLHTKFKANTYILSKEEGGRTTPFFSNYRPQFYFRTTDVTGLIELASGVEMLSPGDTGNITVELENSIAIEIGSEFNIREGGRTVGKGTVTEIIK